jgi:endogenous inhibitor of DNA gyrase (YacG/DUF329 family)
MNPVVKCPTCNRDLEWSSASPYRPFCSERCKLIDLGAWLSEERSIAGEKVAEDAGQHPDGQTPSPAPGDRDA